MPRFVDHDLRLSFLASAIARVVAAVWILFCAAGSGGAQCIRYEDYTHPIGMLEMSSPLYAMAVSGPYAYVADFDYLRSSFHVMDISDPAASREIGSTVLPAQYPPSGIAVLGSLAILTSWYEGDLCVIDVANPGSPCVIGQLPVAGADEVAASGSYAYVTGEALSVVDLSNPTNPEVVARIDAATSGIALSHSYAYVGAREEGLLVIDISDPLHPSVAARLPTPGDAGLVSVSGTYAYLTEYRQGQETLRVIDISNPLDPRLVGSLSGAGGYQIATAGDRVCLATLWGLLVVDVADPVNPRVAEWVELPYWFAYGVAIEPSPFTGDPRIYVSGGSTYDYIAYQGWLMSFDVTGLHQAQGQGRIDLPCAPYDVTASGAYAYVAGGGCGLEVVDATDPQHPAVVGVADTPDRACGVTLAGKLAYVADASSGLQVIDVSDPRAPRIVGSVDTPGTAGEVTVSGSYAYVADGQAGLEVIDVSDPTHPRIAGGTVTPGGALEVAISGAYAYVACGAGGLQVVHVSDPADPRIVGSLNLTVYVTSVRVSGRYAYLAASGTTGLYVVDLEQSDHPRVIGSLANPPISWSGGVAVTRQNVYLATSQATELIDVTDPREPRIKGRMAANLNIYGMAVSESHVFIVEGDGCQDLYRLLVYPSECEPTIGPGVSVPIGMKPPLSAAAWPNPTRGATTVHFSKPAPGWTRVAIWDVTGRLVRTLHDGVLPAGLQDLTWDGRDDASRPVAPGIYWTQVATTQGVSTARILILR